MPADKFRSVQRLYPFVIFIIAFLQYANTISADYAWDDKLVITSNDFTKKGIPGLRDIFTKRVSVPLKNVYRPVPQAMFAVEYDLFHQNPHYSHFFSVCWYSLLCVVIFFFLKYIFPEFNPLFGMGVCVLFAVHPLHAEVVANIKSRDEILALLGGLCAIILLLKATRKQWWLFPGALICFAVAILSKENVITLLPVAGLCCWFSNRKMPGWKWLATGGLVIAGAAIFYWITQTISAREPHTTAHLDATVLNNIFLWTTHPHKIIPTCIVNTGRYLLLFVYPHPLIHMYGYNQVSMEGWYSPKLWTMVLVLLLAGFYLYRNFKRKTLSAFGILFFLITYSVYSNFFVLAPDTMADRYLFIPSLGLCIIAIDIAWYFLKSRERTAQWYTGRHAIVIGLCCLIIPAYFTQTYFSNQDWKNDFTLIYNRIQYMQNNAAAQATYGLMLYKESEQVANETEKRNKRQAAMGAFRRAIEIYPDFYWSWISIGKIFTEEKMYDKAELAFIKAQQLEPMTADGYFCLGALNYTRGDAGMAVTYLEKAVLMEPDAEQYYEMLGLAYFQIDSIANMNALAKSGISRFGPDATFYALQAVYWQRTGNVKEAIRYNQMALQLDPGNRTAVLLRTVLPDTPPLLHHGDSTKTFSTPPP